MKEEKKKTLSAFGLETIYKWSLQLHSSGARNARFLQHLFAAPTPERRGRGGATHPNGPAIVYTIVPRPIAAQIAVREVRKTKGKRRNKEESKVHVAETETEGMETMVMVVDGGRDVRVRAGPDECQHNDNGGASSKATIKDRAMATTESHPYKDP
jgi:hypothetical protein